VGVDPTGAVRARNEGGIRPQHPTQFACTSEVREGLTYRWRTGTAHLLPNDHPRERQRWLANQLPSSAGNARAVRLFGTQLLTVRIDLDT
jgi:hypothetical protein